MTTITALSNASDRSGRRRLSTVDQPAAAAIDTAAAPSMTYEQQVARDTRRLAAITGAAALVILVFFLGMMWLLSGYGPAA